MGLKVVHYLGQVISERGVEMDPSKTSISAWKEPRNVEELRGFVRVLQKIGR